MTCARRLIEAKCCGVIQCSVLFKCFPLPITSVPRCNCILVWASWSRLGGKTRKSSVPNQFWPLSLSLANFDTATPRSFEDHSFASPTAYKLPNFLNIIEFCLCKGSHQNKFSVIVGILSELAWPPYPNVGIPPKEKTCLFCILGYSKHIIFHQKVHFLAIDDFLFLMWFVWLGLGNPHHITTKYQQNHRFVWLWFWF